MLKKDINVNDFLSALYCTICDLNRETRLTKTRHKRKIFIVKLRFLLKDKYNFFNFKDN